MGASASISICTDSSSVRIRKTTAKISPEPAASVLQMQTECSTRPIFGVAVETLREDGQLVDGVPHVLRLMVEFLDRTGVHHKGIFRLSGSVVQTRQLKLRWDSGEVVDLQHESDVPTVASLLKLFFRELPIPLVPEAHRRQLLSGITEYKDELELIGFLSEHLRHLPGDYFTILSYLIHFLARVASHSQSNQMPMENLSTIFGPCVFRVPAGTNMLMEQNACNTLLLHLLRHQDQLFVPLPPPPPPSPHPPTAQNMAYTTPASSPPPPPLSVLSDFEVPPGSGRRERDMMGEDCSASPCSLSSASLRTWSDSRIGSSDTLESSRWERASQLSACIQQLSLEHPQVLDGGTAGSGTSPSPADAGSAYRQPRPGPVRPVPKCREMEAEAEGGMDKGNHRTVFPQSGEDLCSMGAIDPKLVSSVTEQRQTQTERVGLGTESPIAASSLGHGDKSTPLKFTTLGSDQGDLDPAQGTKTVHLQMVGVAEHPRPPLVPPARLLRSTPSALPSQSGKRELSPVQQVPSSVNIVGRAEQPDIAPTPDRTPGTPTSSTSSPSCSSALLLQSMGASDRPVLSPRCPSLSSSLRFLSDPDSAPSPPSFQNSHTAHRSARLQPEEGAKDQVSISSLNRHIHSLRKRIRLFEEQFEQEKHYKPAHNDKTAHPEVARLMKQLIKSRRQLKEMKLKQLSHGGGRREHRASNPSSSSSSTSEARVAGRHQQGAPLAGTELQQLDNGSNSKPSVEETVQALGNRLRGRRRELGLPDNLKEMSQSQLSVEKTTLQKCLLHYEGLHGRPSTRQERMLMKPFYDRYRLLKQLLLAPPVSPVITTIEEEEGSDEEGLTQKTVRPPGRFSSSRSLPLTHSQEDAAETTLVSPLEEVRAVQPPVVTMATLHEASRSELLEQLRTTRLEKKRLHLVLREFEHNFCAQSGRTCQKEDRGPMDEEYCQYKNVKVKLRLLEALLSKQQDSTKTS